MDQVKNNLQAQRFELDMNGTRAYADYRQEDKTYFINYVFAPEILRGTGAAGKLMEGIMNIARASGYKIVPVCSYASSWLRRHSEHQDLVA